MSIVSIADLSEISRKLGLDIVAAAPLKLPAEAKSRLRIWQDRGHAGELRYMLRDPAIFTDAQRLLEPAKTLLVFTLNYSGAAPAELPPGFGRVARYAWGRDYHRVLKRRLAQFIVDLGDSIGISIKHRIFSDAVPLLERAYAENAGVGFIGRNSMLIRPGSGSYFFLAEVLIDIEISGTRAAAVRGSCGSCSACVVNCPTGAIVDDYQIDARRCISYLTIEKKSALSREERAMLGEWIFGCDICQEVCPFNHRAHRDVRDAKALPEFEAAAGCGPFLNLGRVLSIADNAEFLRHFAGTPLMRAGRVGLLRNAAAVAVNTRSQSSIANLLKLFENDRSEILRSHALWAVCRLSKECNINGNGAVKTLIDKGLRDSSAMVRAEAQWAGENLI